MQMRATLANTDARFGTRIGESWPGFFCLTLSVSLSASLYIQGGPKSKPLIMHHH